MITHAELAQMKAQIEGIDAGRGWMITGDVRRLITEVEALQAALREIKKLSPQDAGRLASSIARAALGET